MFVAIEAGVAEEDGDALMVVRVKTVNVLQSTYIVRGNKDSGDNILIL